MALEVLQAAQQLSLLSPSFENGAPVFKTSEPVTVSWKSPYQYTNVEIFQGPDSNGAYATNYLIANATQDQNTVIWDASAILNDDLSVPFFIRLQKGDLPDDCYVCITDTTNFRVVDPNAAVSGPVASASASASPAAIGTSTATTAQAATSTSADSSSSATPTTSTEAATSSTAAATSSTAVALSSSAAPATSSASMASSSAAAQSSTVPAAGAAAESAPAANTATSSFKESGTHVSNTEALALGLGIGIPFGLAMIGMIIFLLWDRRRKNRKSSATAVGHDEQRGEVLEVLAPPPPRTMTATPVSESSTPVNRFSMAPSEDRKSKHSRNTISTYHSRFEFEDDDGRLKEPVFSPSQQNGS